MKVCILTPDFPLYPKQVRGGMATYTDMLAKGLVAKGAEVHVVIYNMAQQDAPIIYELPIKIHWFKLPTLRYFSGFFPGWIEARGLARFVAGLDREHHFDIIEGMNDEGLMTMVARQTGPRFWLRMISSLKQHIESKKQPLNWSRRFSIWLDGVAARRSANLVTHSRLHAEEMAVEYRLPIERIHIVPFAVTDPPATRVTATLPASPATVTYVGTLDQRKGIDVLLEAVPLVHRQVPDCNFLIIGRDGGDSPDTSWKVWFQKKFPAERVNFYGGVGMEQLTTLWAGMTHVVVPSRYESFGIVVIEAFAYAKPVIVTRGGALPEVAKDGALIVDVENPAALATAIVTLVQDRDRARALAQRGREVYDEFYTLAAFAESVWRLYKPTKGNPS